MASCYDWSGHPDLATYIECALPNVFKTVQWISIAAVLVIAVWLTYETVTNQDNPNVIKGMFMKWIYLLIFAIIALTGGGVIFIPLKLIGLGDIDSVFSVLSEVLGWFK